MISKVQEIREAAEADLATKICTACKKEKPLSEYGTRSLKNSIVPKSECKPCNVEVSKRWRLRNMDKVRDAYLKRTYGISLDDYNVMLEQQDYSCMICKKHRDDVVKKELHVDHCHSTGEVRGLLCLFCNTVLGKVNDDVEILEKMIGYLKSRGN